ncbi:unnamed protein product [Brassica rapa subsp. trilocularis]
MSFLIYKFSYLVKGLEVYKPTLIAYIRHSNCAFDN